MNPSTRQSDLFFQRACVFEAGLSLLALILGWLADINPLAVLRFSEPALAYGILGTLPLIGLFFAIQAMTLDSVKTIRTLLENTLCPSLAYRHWTDWLVLSVLAGFSEELLFRGFLQVWMELKWGAGAGLIASALLFGLVHAVTPLYAVLATLIGIYLGLSMDYGGERNLLVPVVIHALYDFAVFWVIMRGYRAKIAAENHDV